MTKIPFRYKLKWNECREQLASEKYGVNAFGVVRLTRRIYFKVSQFPYFKMIIIFFLEPTGIDLIIFTIRIE